MSHLSKEAHNEPEPHTVAVGERGRVVIPAELRRALGIAPGSTLVAHVEDGRRLVFEDRRVLVAEMRGAWRSREHGNRNLSSELLKERAAEAQLEDARVSGDGAALREAQRALAGTRERHDAKRPGRQSR